jgi:WD40 repeat protein
MAAGYENSTIIIWKDNTLTTNTKLNGHEKKVKSLALFGNDLLASGSCDSTIKIWNLTTASNIKNLTEHEGCVNSLVSLDFLNKTYLISASDDSTI